MSDEDNDKPLTRKERIAIRRELFSLKRYLKNKARKRAERLAFKAARARKAELKRAAAKTKLEANAIGEAA